MREEVTEFPFIRQKKVADAISEKHSVKEVLTTTERNALK